MAKNKGIFPLLSLLVLVALLSGCAGTIVNMRLGPPAKVIMKPDNGKALVVFMRPSGMGFAVQSSVFEVKGDTASLVGVVAAKSKVGYQVEPGKHLFMVVSEAADFMVADLQAGKTYYVLVVSRPGVWKARFSLKPLHANDLNSPKFTEWFLDCKWVEKSAESDAWANKNMPDIEAKQAKYYKVWESKHKGSIGLYPEDGR